MAGVPISLLPDGITPYTGEERFAFVQDNDTKANSLESFTSFYEKYFITYDLLGSLSGNWQQTYNLFTVKGALWDISYSITSNLSSNWNSVYTTVNVNSASWGRTLGDFCDTVVYMRDVTSCNGTDTINISANLDLEGYSINNIGNSSLVFESGAKFSSNTEGGVKILPNPSNIPGPYGTVIGLDNDAPAREALASGVDNTASGAQSVASGKNNTASGPQSVASGKDNTATGPQSVASGKETTTEGDTAFAHGYYNIANAPYSIAGGGNNNLIDPLGLNGSIIGGENNALSGESASIIAGTQHKVSSFASVVLGGQANEILNDASIIAGGADNIADCYSGAIIASQNSKVNGNANNAIIATDNASLTGEKSVIIGGELTTTDGNYAVSLGAVESSVSSQYGVLIGGRNGHVGHEGAKVFADTSTTPFSSISANTFNIQADGLRLVDGNEADGYVLTCDADGTGTWQLPTGGNNFCGVTVYMDSLSACGASNTLTIDGDLDIGGGSLLNVGNNSITFESGASIGSNVDGDIVLGANTNLTNIDTLCATTIHSVSSVTHYQDIIVSELSGFDVTGDVNIVGDVAVTGVLSGGGGTSTQWDNTYTTVSANSATWDNTANTLDSITTNGATTTNDITVGRLVTGGNTISGLGTLAIGGLSLSATNNYAVSIGGLNSLASGKRSIVLGGSTNEAIGDDSEVLGGSNSKATAAFSTVVGGGSLSAANTAALAAGGIGNLSNGLYSSIIGGSGSVNNSNYSAIVGASNAVMSSGHNRSVILGGVGLSSFAANTVYVPNLDIDDSFKMPTGATDGYVLTTDANGVGTWQAESAEIGVACSDEITDLTTGTSKTTLRMPYAMNLTSVRASVNTAPVGSDITVDINEGGVSILDANKLTIDDGSKTSVGSGTAYTITDTALADDAEITVDIDAVGSTTTGKGLKIWLIGTKA